ncbi:hypothetical protein P3W24_02410 [Luteibacter sp. PPL201]|uniref:Uncharacterized protein n=1 Tax=Luteibacter sahnii TaxID=3021977 RepID=A0ABT6B6U7_9GAMM
MSMLRPLHACTAIALSVASASTVAQTVAPSFGPAMPVERLRTMSGGTATAWVNNVNEQDIHGTLSDNRANQTYSGANVVGDTAFGNAAGLPTVIQNSGNNVLIQNAMIVNVRMNP